jgi:APA family basic amino acid/polyamine antiporter
MSSNLPRILSFRDLVLLTLGSVIGSGIFIVPSAVLEQTGGSFTAAMAVWVIGGVLSVLGALTYGELGAMKPEAGGLYVYMRDAFGELTAFLYGWALFLVISSATIATLAVAFSGYLGQFVQLGALANKAVAIGMIVVITVINVLSTRQSANVQNVSTAIKVGAILVMSAFLIGSGDGFSQPAPTQTLSSMGLLTGMGAAMIGVLWAYEAWQYVTFSAGEVVDPQRNFGRGIVLGTAALVFLYLLANVGYVAALGLDRASHSPRIASEAVSAVFGAGAGKLIAAAILVSIFSAAHATVMTSPRVYFAMARDGLFFKRISEVHPRFGTPALAIVVSSAWAAVLAATGTFEQLLTYVVFTGWIFYALGAAAIFHYRRRHPDAPRPFRTPGYPWTPILFIASGGAIVLNTLATQPGRALVGLGIVLLGVPAFWFWRRRRSAT